MPYCAKCEKQLPEEIKVFRQTLCPECSAYLHSCVQCAFHDKNAHNECLEPQAEFVSNREKSNFCEFFQLAGTSGSAGGGAGGRPAGRADRDERAQAARAKLEALFKKPEDDGASD
jgi:hypothetical protein